MAVGRVGHGRPGKPGRALGQGRRHPQRCSDSDGRQCRRPPSASYDFAAATSLITLPTQPHRNRNRTINLFVHITHAQALVCRWSAGSDFSGPTIFEPEVKIRSTLH
jgi:hypothetical protein